MGRLVFSRWISLSIVAQAAGIFFVIVLTTDSVSGQAVPDRFIAGLELQAYPAGFIGDAQYSFLFSQKQIFTFHAGFNTTNRRDWGEHDDETGAGAGLGLSWRYYLNEAPQGLHLGIRTDLWFLKIDWVQNAGGAGTTDIIVFQPTAQLGYSFIPAQSPWIFDATVSLGAEINVQTEGEPVGEGAIFLVGAGVGYRF